MFTNKQVLKMVTDQRLIKWQSLFVGVILLTLLTACASTKPTKTLTKDLQNGVKTYRVKSGDTLYAISFRAGYDYHQLARWNRIKPPYIIKVGQILKLYQATKNPRAKNSKEKVLKLYWQWPVQGRLIKNFYATDKKGIDILGKYGQNVKAAAGGKVVYSGNNLIGYGNLLIIKHNEIYLSAYANNSQLLVKEGQYVKKGQIIGAIGRTKNQSTSLHFEIRKYGKPVNPVNFLPK